jgi:hypothetical protein
MILFQLACANDHRFEAWFRDSAAFDRQCAAGDIGCPFCASARVSKAPMAPHVVKSAAKADNAEDRAQKVTRELMEVMENLRRHVEDKCDYVGVDFPEEARRIHYGEADPRGIYGEASENEASALKEEGIEVHRFPWLNRRNN